MKKTLGTNSSTLYILPILAIGVMIYAILTIEELNIFLIIIFFLIIMSSYLGFLTRPKNCILADQKYLYLYPKYKKEITIELKKLKDVSLSGLARRRYTSIRITTKDNLVYHMYHVSSMTYVVKAIKDLIPKETDSLDPFNPFDIS